MDCIISLFNITFEAHINPLKVLYYYYYYYYRLNRFKW